MGKDNILSHEKEWKLAIHKNMDESKGYSIKWKKSERQIVWFNLYVKYKSAK